MLNFGASKPGLGGGTPGDQGLLDPYGQSITDVKLFCLCAFIQYCSPSWLTYIFVSSSVKLLLSTLAHFGVIAHTLNFTTISVVINCDRSTQFSKNAAKRQIKWFGVHAILFTMTGPRKPIITEAFSITSNVIILEWNPVHDSQQVLYRTTH